MKIPANYLPIMPYLILNKEKAFLQFCKTVFGAQEQLIVPQDDRIMHGELRIFNAVIMFAGATDVYKEKSSGMYLYVDDVSIIYEKALSENAKSLMTPDNKGYGFTAGFEDPFGNQWWIVQAEKEC